MNSIFLTPGTNKLRSGWRALLFVILSPFAIILIGLLLPKNTFPADAEPGTVGLDWPTILSYVVQIAWLLLLSWGCLKLLEKLSLRTLGLWFFRGWFRELALGLAISGLMIVLVVILQAISGGSRLMPNPLFWKSVDGLREIDVTGVWLIAGDLFMGLLLFGLAATFEELVFRGYPFQTLLRGGLSPAVPIIILSMFFGLVHLGNPSSTVFSTANTILAGIWLSAGYLKTRSLWFPTGLHLGWNWIMGIVFGLPVSGIRFGRHPVFLTTSNPPVWATGGAYGSEGGIAATIVLVLATVLIWNARWLKPASEMENLKQESQTPESEVIKLGLME